MPKPWNAKVGRSIVKQRLQKDLIVSEDEKSSVLYFKAFKIPEDLLEFYPEAAGMSTDRLVTEALTAREKAIHARKPYRRIWCVFDKDDSTTDQYNRAFQLVEKHNDIEIIWSNECFELWYLLHYAYRDTGLSRAEIFRLLKTHLGRSYNKTDQNVYSLLLSKQSDAIRNAKRLLNFHGPDPLEQRRNPSTNAHRLVERLNELSTLRDR